jgi:RHS repeat-associated protein
VYTYDETGQALSMKDPLHAVTQYSYADSYTSGTPPGNTNTYLTKVTRPTTNGVAHISNYSYGYKDGQLTVAKDENGQMTTYAYTDPLDRLSQITYPPSGSGGETIYTYNDSPPSPSVTTQQEISAGTSLTTVKVMDGMGHVTETELTSDPSGADRTVTTYNGLGKPYFAYNPTRCSTPTTNCGESTWGYATYTYDALGRAKLVTNPDNSTVQTSYIGRATEVTDEGNGTKSVQRISQTDGLGRMVSVCEVSSTTLTVGASPTPASCSQDIGGTGFLTSYQYDALNDLVGVSQAGLNPRSFAYDSLSRLTSSANPESGTVNYAYDGNGNMTARTDARNIATTYTYDVLNRLTQKSYSDGTPTANFFYDANVWHNINLTNTVGRLSYDGALSSSGYVASEAFSYDSMGRVINNSQCAIPTCSNGPFSVTYSYDLLGDMTSTTPGAPVTLTYGYNSAAQLTSVTSSLSDANHPSSLLSDVQYNAPGRLASAFMGTNTSTSGISESRTYDKRLRTLVISTGVNTPTGYVGLVGMTYGYAPNGNVTSLADGPTGNWNFTYDDFNRLQSTVVPAYSTSPYAYVYDRYGNRWKQTANGTCTAGTAFCISFDANNRVTGGILTYDAAGNVIADNMHHYTYDAENRLTQVDAGTTASYAYDASGHRIQKTTAGTTVYYVYDLNGHVVTENGTAGAWNRSEVYAGSRHLVTYRDSLTYFSSVDALGSERVRSTQNESSYESCDSLPFGDDQYCFGSAVGNVSPLHFTGKERDSESNLDNFEARYMASSLGRFMSPDPNNSSGFDNQDDPQSWNGYSYARNNPLRYTDPSGEKYTICDNSGNCQALSDVQFGNDFQTNPNVQLTGSQIYIQDSDGKFNLEGTYHAGSSDDSTGGPQNDFLGESLIGAFAGGAASAGRGLVSGLLESGSEQAAMAEVRAAGQLGEELAGIVKNTERIPSLTGTASYRVPDILDHGAQVIGEVKNYNGTLSLTAQIRDDLAYAARNGYQMILKVSQTTTFTQPLQQLVDRSIIQVTRF